MSAKQKANQPHDKLFRHSMLLPKVARQFLEAWLPEEFLLLVDWSTLSVQKISGTDESLKERREDVVYRLQTSGKTVHFYILLEHQTRPERRMALRCLEYAMALWRAEVNSKVLPMVIPIVVHPGPGGWKSPRRLRDLIEIPAQLASWAQEFIPDAGYLVAELAGHPMEQLASGSLGQAVMSALQAERRGKMSYRQVKTIVETLYADGNSPEATRLARQLWVYLLEHSELKDPQIREIVESTVPQRNQSKFMSTAQRLRQEGRQEGRQEAIIQLLKLRHKRIPAGLLETLSEVSDEGQLGRLLLAAAQSTTIEEFTKSL